MPRLKIIQELKCSCGRMYTDTDKRRKTCDWCRASDPHRHRARKAKVNHMLVCVDTEWRTVFTDLGEQAKLETLSLGREDGSSETCIAPTHAEMLMWLINRLSGKYVDADGKEWKQHAIGFHLNGDSGILARDFTSPDMYLIRKARTTLKTVLCGSTHAEGEICPLQPDSEDLMKSAMDEAATIGNDVWVDGTPAGILHRFDAGDVQAVITEGGEGDVIAYDPESSLAIAISPKRRLYIEHRPHGDRYEQCRVVDIHDIGTALPGGLEKVIDDWAPTLSANERELIAWGKQFRKGWPLGVDIERVAAYSEAECVATARVARKLIDMIKQVAHVPMQEKDLYGSGSIAGAVMKHYRVPTRAECVKSNDLVMGVPIDLLAKLDYFGGLIETPVVGLVMGRTDEVDLTSAYPHKINMLPCMREEHGEWVTLKRGESTPDSALVGHVLASWSVKGWYSTGPFTIRRKDCSVMQPMAASHVWVPLVEYRAAVEQFGSQIICHKLVYWRQVCDDTPFGFIQEMFDKRAAIKAEMKTLDEGSDEWWHLHCRQNTLKLILNSIYGKLAQQRPVLGKYANLHLASFITGATRAQVRMESHAREAQGGTVVYQHTDSVLSQGGTPVDGGNALGAWKLEHPSIDLLILQPGLATALGGGKTATRGCGKDVFIQAAEEYAKTTDFTQHPMMWPKLELDEHTLISRRVAQAMGKPWMAGAFVKQHMSINPVSHKRDVGAAERMSGVPTAWTVPLIEVAYADEVAGLEDIKVYRTQLERRSRAGEFDNDLH